MAIQNFFKKNPGWAFQPKKNVLFTGHIEDNVKIFRFVDAHGKKHSNFTDQIEDNELNMLFRGYGTWFFLFFGAPAVYSIKKIHVQMAF